MKMVGMDNYGSVLSHVDADFPPHMKSHDYHGEVLVCKNTDISKSVAFRKEVQNKLSDGSTLEERLEVVADVYAKFRKFDCGKRDRNSPFMQFARDAWVAYKL